jgi:hypothetical protein
MYCKESNIKLDIKKLGYKDVAWVQVVQNRVLWRDVVSSAMSRRVPQ